MSEWISVDERLPEKDRWYVALARDEERDFNTGALSTHYVLFRGYPGKSIIHGALWWFPLPDPPKEPE